MLVISVFICLYAMQAFYFSKQNAANASVNTYKHAYIHISASISKYISISLFYFYATSARGLR